MNIPVLIAGCLTLITFVAHIVQGTRETAALEPSQGSTLTKHWVQSMCAFQMISVDLLAIALLLCTAALLDLGPFEPPLLLGLALLNLGWATAWVIQLRWLNRPAVTLLGLPQWTIFVVCAALILLGR